MSRMLLGSLLLLLAACAGGGASNPPSGPANPPSGITVSGRVIDAYGQGVGGFSVRIGSTTVTTAADGSFSISGVTPPYDAVVFDKWDKVAYYYKGLTRPDPNLTVIGFSFFSSGNRNAYISGSLSGGAGFPSTYGHKALVFFGSPETAYSNNTDYYSHAASTYSLDVRWFGPSSTSGKLYALQWEFNPANYFPIDYKGFGSKPLTLSSGSTFMGQDMTLSPVDEDTLSGSVSVPAGYALEERKVGLRVAPGSGTLLLEDSSTNLDFSRVTPRIPGATVWLSASATSGNKVSQAWKAGLATDASNVSLSLPAAPQLTAPANGTTGVTTGTVFQTTGFSGGVNVFHFNGSPKIYVITTANTTTIPDLSAIGLGLPTSGAASYEWRVFGFAPFASVDAAAGPGGLMRDFTKAKVSGAGPDADGSFARSEILYFNTP